MVNNCSLVVRSMIIKCQRRTHHIIPHSISRVLSPRVAFMYLCERCFPLTCLPFLGLSVYVKEWNCVMYIENEARQCVLGETPEGSARAQPESGGPR